MGHAGDLMFNSGHLASQILAVLTKYSIPGCVAEKKDMDCITCTENALKEESNRDS